MVGVAHGSLEVENSVKCPAGTNPLIYRLTRLFPVLTVVVRTFVRRQCRAEHPNSVQMRALDDLLQAQNELLSAYQLAGKGRLFSGSTIRQSRLHVRPADVVNSFEHDQVDDTRLCQDISIEARKRVHSRAVAQYAISANTLIYNGSAGPLLGSQSIRQKVGPIGILALRCSNSIRN